MRLTLLACVGAIIVPFGHAGAQPNAIDSHWDSPDVIAHRILDPTTSVRQRSRHAGARARPDQIACNP